MLSSSKTPPRRRGRPLAWFLAGAAAAAVCLGGVLAGREWLEPEPGIIPASSVQRATLAEPDPALAEAPVEEAEPPAPFVPWAWLDEPVPSESVQPESVQPESVQLDAQAEPALAEEQRVYVTRSEVQPVAGTDGPEAATELAASTPPAPPPPDSAAPQTESELGTAVAEPPAPGEPCGSSTCQAGYGCCNPSCGVCVAPGESCDPTPCESRITYPVSQMCGRATCSVGEVCCNPSCGTCVAPGESCDLEPCDNAIQYPVSALCGRVTCSVGQECCNPSCGTCVSPGETCDQERCD